MENKFFRYKTHPGDFLRNTDIIQFPNPDKNLEEFLISFLNHFQSDNRIAYLDDLYKLMYDEFDDESDKLRIIEEVRNKNISEIKEEISYLETELKNEAYRNFYQLLLENKIEIIHHYEEQ
jgi:phage-related protein